jgi:hypothetical protein
VTPRPPLPKSFDDVTLDWLLAAFAYEGTNLQVDDDIQIRPLPDTSGLWGSYGIVKSGVAASDGPRELFVKITDLPSTVGGFFLHMQVREQDFFREFSSTVAARVPEFFYGDYSEDFRSGVLITESLDDWEMGSSVEGINIDQAVATGHALGLLNGSTLEAQRTDAGAYYLRYYPGSVMVHLVGDGYQTTLGKHREFLEGHLSAELFEFTDRIKDEAGRILVEVKSGDTSVNHGDCRIENVAFRNTPEGVEAALFDFGLLTIGNGMPDLAQCVPSAWSEATEEGLMTVAAVYRDAMREAGPFYRSADETWDMFRRAMALGFIIRTMALHSFDSPEQLESGTPVEQMRINTWRNMVNCSELLRIWEMF